MTLPHAFTLRTISPAILVTYTMRSMSGPSPARR